MGNYLNKMSAKVKDESFTIPLPGSNIVFTRYLYLKDEVKLAFLVSLLNKSDDAIFWAYELYYSGFQIELYDYIWKIYYDFFATRNPSFEQYLNKMLKIDKEKDDKLVSAIVQDLLIRPFNTDIFFLRTICNLFEIDCNIINKNKVFNLYEQLTMWIDAKDFKSIAQYILNIVTLDTNIYSVAIDIFSDIYNLNIVKSKLLKEFNVAQERISTRTLYEKKVFLLTKVMTLFSLKEKLVKGKNFYIVVDPEDIIQYETIDTCNNTNFNCQVKHYKVLDVARICGIDDLKHLSLFRLERDTLQNVNVNGNVNENETKLKHLYFNDWLYYASFSPVWFNRIKEYSGYVDYTCIKVKFVDEDRMQLFYDKYGYEPDEQSQKTSDKSLKINTGIDWATFHNNFKSKGMFSLDEYELEELNNDKIHY